MRGVARVVAMSVAARVSQEMGVKLGNEVRGVASGVRGVARVVAMSVAACLPGDGGQVRQ